MSTYESENRDCKQCGRPLAGDNPKSICWMCQRETGVKYTELIKIDDPRYDQIVAGRHFNELENEAIELGLSVMIARAMTDGQLVSEIACRRK